MAAEPGYIDDSLLENDSVRIRVFSHEHNGKTWLHKHHFYEFVYIDRGFTLHSHNGKTSVLTAGDLFAICPNEAHSYSSAYHTVLYNCLFYLDELKGLSDEILRLPGMSELLLGSERNPFPALRVGLSERQEIVLILEKMKWERINRGAGWELSLKSLLISFLIFYSRLYSAGQARSGAGAGSHLGYIYKALQFIEENYQNDIGGRDIAACTGLSHDYVAKQFKQELSMTPSEYIRRFRVAKSMELLKTTDMPAAEIALEVGFSDISLYSRVFKQLIGVSPSAFRKNDGN